MKHYHIHMAYSAEEDLNGIAEYYAVELQEPAAALKQVQEIKETVFSLQELPERHSLVKDGYLAKKGIRKIQSGRYLVFYRVEQDNNRVHIIRVLHERRNWVDLL